MLASPGKNKNVTPAPSGGLIEEMVDILPRVIGFTTCTRKGYGYDSSLTHSGAWTNQFLLQGLEKNDLNTNLDLIQVFEDARMEYCRTYHNKGDWPCDRKRFFQEASRP